MKKNDKRNWKQIFKNNKYVLTLIWKACPSILLLSFIATVLSAIHAFLLNTYLYMYALNALQEGKELKIILIILGGMIAYSIIYHLFCSLSDCYLQTRYPKLEAYIQNLLQKKASEVDLACFENAAFYDTYVKAKGETTNRINAVMNNILNVIWVTINVISRGTLITIIDPVFLLVAFVPLICTLIIGHKRNHITYECNMKIQEIDRRKDYVRRTFYLKEFSKEMRLTNMWKVMFKRMHSSIRDMKEIVHKYGYKIMFFQYLMNFAFDVVVYSGTIILTTFKTLVLKNMLLGDCFVVINSISNVASSLNHFGNTLFKLTENSLYINNLRAFLEYEVRIFEDEEAPEIPCFEKIEFQHVTFGYRGQENVVLSDVNLQINKGEKIAVVGHNGAGKTTFIKLLQRFYDPNQGEILLNGENIKNYRLSSYRNMFGTVFQDSRIFALSIAENVMLRGNLTIEDKEIVKDALIRSGIHKKIETLPNGVDSQITKEFDDEGVIFSGGEEQKIYIARLFAGEQAFIIMDEPTSALDPIAEQEMYRNMFEASEGKAVVFISHRLSSAAMADRIYMLENGKIIEQGTHSELLALNGKYADMWNKQAKTYIDTEE